MRGMILDYKNYHLVGIQGVGMTALAFILTDQGKVVTGSDNGEEFLTGEYLQKRLIKLFTSFSTGNISEAECVIYTGAHGGVNNIEVQEAINKKIPVYSLAQFVGEITKSKKTLSICGCHGKTTTTALAVLAGESLNIPMSFYVGGAGFADHPSGKWQEDGFFAVESDEYVADPIADKVPKFFYIHPVAIVCTNIDFDHPDVYSSIEEIEKVYLDYFKRLPPQGKLIICGDDERLLRIAQQSGKKFVRYGVQEKNDFVLKGSSIYYQSKELVHVSSGLIGEHNMLNIAGVVALYASLGYDVAKLSSTFKNFTGVSRRQEKIYERGGKILIDDYGHHPAEIAATIKAVKQVYPTYYIVVVFQPHTFSRTEALKKEFVIALSMADESFVLPIFASAREVIRSDMISSDILITISNRLDMYNIQSIHSDTEITALIEKLKAKHPKLVLITMGAGDIYKKHKVLIDILRSSS